MCVCVASDVGHVLQSFQPVCDGATYHSACDPHMPAQAPGGSPTSRLSLQNHPVVPFGFSSAHPKWKALLRVLVGLADPMSD